MTYKEALKQLGVNIPVLLERFSNNEALLCKFILRFTKDPTMSLLQTAVKEKDYSDVLMQAHTLKGVTANLGFEQLSKECNHLVIALRASDTASCDRLNADICTEYDRIVDVLQQISD